MLMQRVKETVQFIRSKTNLQPDLALVLGSGLGYFADRLESPTTISFAQLPHFVQSTAPGHSGRLIIGTLKGKTILCMQGRFHYYEGYSMEQITYPIRVMKGLGIHKLILTNACGGLDPNFKPGDLMLVSDHINFMGHNPLIGPNHEEFGVRFTDMTKAYNREMRAIIRNVAEKVGIALKEGVYIGYSGPSFETPAEIKLFQSFGANAVGMSTVPEVIVANHCGIQTAAISCITNLAAGILDVPLSGEEVIEVAAQTAPKFINLLEQSIAQLT